jgi:hypothetical protein
MIRSLVIWATRYAGSFQVALVLIYCGKQGLSPVLSNACYVTLLALSHRLMALSSQANVFCTHFRLNYTYYAKTKHAAGILRTKHSFLSRTCGESLLPQIATSLSISTGRGSASWRCVDSYVHTNYLEKHTVSLPSSQPSGIWRRVVSLR